MVRKSNKRISSLLAVAIIIAMASASALPTIAASQQTPPATPAASPLTPSAASAASAASAVSLAEWDIASFTGSVARIDATGGIFRQQSGLRFIKAGAAQDLNFSSGGANLSGLNGQAGAAWWDAELSSEGCSGIEVSWNMRSSGTGPRDFRLQYSTDGVTWADAIDPAVAVPNAVAIGNTRFTKSLPAGAEGSAALRLRWLLTSDISARAGTGTYPGNDPVQAGGTHQINSIAVTGASENGGGGDGDGDGDGDVPKMTVAQARANVPSSGNGPEATVTGVVTYRYNATGLHIQDGTGANDGIYVYVPGASLDASDWVGKQITATGFLLSYNGLPEIQAALSDIQVDGDAPVVYTPATLADIAAGKYICMAVSVADVQLTARNAATTLQNHTVSSAAAAGGGPGGPGRTDVTLRAALPASFAQGDWLTINKGYVYVYQNAPQIMCDTPPDIVPGAEPPPPPPPPETDGPGTLAEWDIGQFSGSVSSIGATGGDFAPESDLRFVKGGAEQSLSFSSGGANLSGLNGAAGDAWWLASLSSAGFANLEVSWNMRSSATGPRDFLLQYSADGVTWADAVDPAITVPSAVAIGGTRYAKSLPAGAWGKDRLYIRWLMASEASANGGTIGSGGTHQINYIAVAGEYALGEGQLRRPTADPPGGAVPLWQLVSFAPGSQEDAGAEGYAILASANGGATWGATVGDRVVLASLPASVQIKAVAPGKADSRVNEYSFTQAKLPLVTSSRNSGAVLPNSTIALNCQAPGAAIVYQVNGGGEQPYGGPITLADELFVGDPATLTVTAWARMDGYITGDPQTYAYTRQAVGGEKVYFGQLHSHTNQSDGAGTLAEAYAWARDHAGLDFFAVTDHSNSFDTAPAGDRAGTYDLDGYNAANAAWQAGRAAAEAARADGFVSFYGFEMTWSGGPGHMNTLNTEGFVSRNNAELNGKANDSGLRAYYELLKTAPGSISMFNHPGTTFGNFNNFGYYDPVVDERVTLLEVGNGEGAVGSGGYFRSYEQYTLALDKGWHVAPTNDQDNHLRNWGDSNTCRTAIWTNDLSLGGVYQALRDMRVYATEVADLEITYSVNGMPLGTVLDEAPAAATFAAEIDSPTPGNTIKSVCLVTNGGAEIRAVSPGGQSCSYSQTVVGPAAGYYYLKVAISTPQGDRYAVTAPVWLGRGKAAGFVGVEKSSAMAVTGEELEIRASLFNNEPEPATLLSMEYAARDGTVLGSFPGLGISIAPAGEAAHSMRYTPQVPGDVAVTASAEVLFADGTARTYTYDIAYTVWDADGLAYIGVDGSHYNEYVDGNYKDNMANFTEIAADYGVRVEVLRTGEALVGAAANPKYQALVLTAPSRRVDPAATNPTTSQPYGAHRSYSQAELDAVASFAARGGTVVLSGWSNVYESYSYTSAMPLDEHMASQQNRVLAAIGSTLRLSDDAARDPLQWSSDTDPYRLYLDDAHGSYDWSSPLLAGVDRTQVFSQYGGSTIYAVAPADRGAWDAAPASSVPQGVSPAVVLSAEGESANRETYPPGTNYRTDYTRHGGRLMVLASEAVDHGGGAESLVIAAGGAFMSNFEVKIEMENASTLQYSNYNIALNLIRSVAPAAEVVGIADAKKMAEGAAVTVEGVATTNVYKGGDAANTGFFDCIYIQDATGGINLFPVSSGVEEGQRVRVSGTVGSYQGETQIQVRGIEAIDGGGGGDGGDGKIAPMPVTAAQAMSPEYTGMLVSVAGVVTEVVAEGGVVEQFMVADASGEEARVYINSYITPGVDLSFVKAGAAVRAVGLASVGENRSSGDPLPRIRVRDRAEIAEIAAADKTRLASLVESAGKIYAGAFTADTAAGLASALAAARAALGDAAAAQGAVDAACAGLAAAIGSLKANMANPAIASAAELLDLLVYTALLDPADYAAGPWADLMAVADGAWGFVRMLAGAP